MTRRQIAWELADKNTRQADEMCRHLHLAVREEGERFGRYYLRPPGEARFISYTWAEVVILRHGVVVHGDCDTVVFKGFYRNDAGPRAPLYWVGSYNYSYAESKADYGRAEPRAWDYQVCRQEILEWRRGRVIDADAARELFDAAHDGASQHEWLATMWRTSLDSEYSSAGEITPWPIFAAQAVLRRLIALLEAEDFRKSSHEWFRRAA